MINTDYEDRTNLQAQSTLIPTTNIVVTYNIRRQQTQHKVNE